MKKILSYVLSLSLLLALVACGGNDNTTSKSTPSQATTETSTDESTPETDAPDESSLPQGTGTALIVYTNSGGDGRGDWLVERAAQDGFNIQYVHAGAAKIQDRLLSEANAPIADVVFGLNSIIWETLKAKDMFISYVPSWADEISEGLNDTEGYYHAIVKQAILLVYDSEQVDNPPSDWVDIWSNEEYYGAYEIPSGVGGGTTRNVLAGILTRYTDDDGDLGISEEGWEQIRLFFANGTSGESGVDLYAQFTNDLSPVLMGQMWSSGIDAREAEYGVTTGIVVPDVGVPYAVEGIGIVNGTKNLDEAQLFVEWFGSAQIQGEWAQEFDTLPANEIAAEQASEFSKYIGTIPAQDIDWGLVAENIDAWCEKIELQYMN